ncbi:MAG TPA: hypothetical protein VM287_06555 [Egibacteraceae bacterium]|nr:hypothetical protein [Egibacteraceae bacterium]
MTDRLVERIHTGEQGLAGASLIIVIAWALAAVLMLTGTLVAAQTIDERVFEIRHLVSDIHEGTQFVELTQDINANAAGILDAAQPLSGQADQVIEAAGSIDGTVDSILATAGDINQTAGQINTNVLAIGGTAGGIGGSVDTIHAGLSGTLDYVRSISQGVADINGRADVIIAAVNQIKADTGAIVAEVGNHNVHSITGHAHSIDCHPAVNLLGLLSGSAC